MLINKNSFKLKEQHVKLYLEFDFKTSTIKVTTEYSDHVFFEISKKWPLGAVYQACIRLVDIDEAQNLRQDTENFYQAFQGYAKTSGHQLVVETMFLGQEFKHKGMTWKCDDDGEWTLNAQNMSYQHLGTRQDALKTAKSLDAQISFLS